MSTTTRFTQGKWESRNHDSVIYAPNGHRREGNGFVDGVVIAYTCLLDSYNGSNPDEELRANVALMSAAPEMYELLQSYITHFECGSDDYDLYQTAKELLARLDGKEAKDE